MLFRSGALGAAGLSLNALLAACGGSKTPSTTAPSTAAGADTTSAGASGGVTWMNWPLYIENDDPKSSKTLANFEAASGIKVDYRPEIDGNDTFAISQSFNIEGTDIALHGGGGINSATLGACLNVTHFVSDVMLTVEQPYVSLLMIGPPTPMFMS